MNGDREMGRCLAILRSDGRSFDVDTFLERWPKVRAKREDVWHRNEVYRGPGARRKALLKHITGSKSGRFPKSGFNLALGEANSESEMAALLFRFLSAKRAATFFRDLKKSGADSMIDIGLFVGSRKSFVSSVMMEPNLLRRLAQLHVTLRVVGYPCSD
jgi:hypothetical protein